MAFCAKDSHIQDCQWRLKSVRQQIETLVKFFFFWFDNTGYVYYYFNILIHTYIHTHTRFDLKTKRDDTFLIDLDGLWGHSISERYPGDRPFSDFKNNLILKCILNLIDSQCMDVMFKFTSACQQPGCRILKHLLTLYRWVVNSTVDWITVI